MAASKPRRAARVLIVGLGTAAMAVALAPGREAGAGEPVPDPGTVFVTKTVTPANYPDWSFDITLDDGPDGMAPSTKTATKAVPTVVWEDLPAGTYTLVETLPPGWTQDGDPHCDAPSGGSGGSVQVALGGDAASIAGIRPQVGESVNCYFANNAPIQLLLQKATVGGKNDGQFIFEVTNQDGTGGVLASGFIAPDEEGTYLPSPPLELFLPPGDLKIAETSMPPLYRFYGGGCWRYPPDVEFEFGFPIGAPIDSTGTLPAEFDEVSYGQIIWCQVVDEKLATLSVTKTVVGPAPWSFDFTIFPVPPGEVAQKQATNVNPTVTWNNLEPTETYTISEPPSSGYTSGPLVCTGDTGNRPEEGPSRVVHHVVAGGPPPGFQTDSVEPGNGDVITCTITNTNIKADLALTKTADVDQAGLDGNISWTLHVTNTGGTAASSVVVNDTLPLDLQFVSVTAPAGWDCSESGPGSPAHVGCKKASMAVGESADIVVTSKVIDLGAAQIDNCAYVGTSTAEISYSNNTGCDTVIVEDLPETGSDPSPMAWVGFGLVGIGGLFTMFTRRRKHARA